MACKEQGAIKDMPNEHVERSMYNARFGLFKKVEVPRPIEYETFKLQTKMELEGQQKTPE